METIMALGAWNWMILAAVLFVLELTAPESGGHEETPPTSSVSTGDATTILSTTTKDNSARALGVIGIALGAVALVAATGALLRKRRA